MPSAPYIKSAPPSRQALLTRRQAAELLDVSIHALEKWAERNKGPTFYRRGFYSQSQTAYRIEDIEKFVRERRADYLARVSACDIDCTGSSVS